MSGAILSWIFIACRRVDLSKVTLVHPLVPSELCQKLGMPALEDVVTEQLDDRQPLQIIDSIQVQSSKHLQATSLS